MNVHAIYLMLRRLAVKTSHVLPFEFWIHIIFSSLTLIFLLAWADNMDPDIMHAKSKKVLLISSPKPFSYNIKPGTNLCVLVSYLKCCLKGCSVSTHIMANFRTKFSRICIISLISFFLWKGDLPPQGHAVQLQIWQAT